jgi:hypothetical protein
VKRRDREQVCGEQYQQVARITARFGDQLCKPLLVRATVFERPKLNSIKHWPWRRHGGAERDDRGGALDAATAVPSIFEFLKVRSLRLDSIRLERAVWIPPFVGDFAAF